MEQSLSAETTAHLTAAGIPLAHVLAAVWVGARLGVVLKNGQKIYLESAAHSLNNEGGENENPGRSGQRSARAARAGKRGLFGPGPGRGDPAGAGPME